MKRTKKGVKKPGDIDVNGLPIPKYIVHGGPELSAERGLRESMCQYIDDQPTSEEHRKKREAMWERWVKAGAEHVYPSPKR